MAGSLPKGIEKTVRKGEMARHEQFLHFPQCFQDNNKFDENGRKFSKGIENTVGKGEIARHEQFLLFAQCFQGNYKIGENGRKFFIWDRKHCVKRRYCPLRAISSFPTVFSKDLYCRNVKNRGLFG